MFTKKNSPKMDPKPMDANQDSFLDKETKTSPARNGNTDKKARTKIIIKYDVGFNNQVFIRGKGAQNLSWEKGQLLKNVKADEWVWETETPFSGCEFKVLVNDRTYEDGENHHLTYGSTVVYTPRFPGK